MGARDFWLEPWEKEAIIGFHLKNPLEGYQRMTFMMLDHDVVAVSPSVWRVLQQAGLLSRWETFLPRNQYSLRGEESAPRGKSRSQVRRKTRTREGAPLPPGPLLR